MTDDLCPVCGKSDWEPVGRSPLTRRLCNRPISHLECVQQVNESLARTAQRADSADAAIAELGAKLANLKEKAKNFGTLMHELMEAKEQAESENERLRSTLIAVYRSPLLDESAYHTRGEDIPQDVWDVCEAIRNAVQRDWKPRDEAPHA